MVARQPTGLKLLRQVGLNDQVQRPLSETNAYVKNLGEGVVAKGKANFTTPRKIYLEIENHYTSHIAQVLTWHVWARIRISNCDCTTKWMNTEQAPKRSSGGSQILISDRSSSELSNDGILYFSSSCINPNDYFYGSSLANGICASACQ